MKKLLLATVLILELSSVVYANINDEVRQQCQHLIYGSGHSNEEYDAYMRGLARGVMYTVNESDKTEFAKAVTHCTQVKERACMEALYNKGMDSFLDRYLWGVSVTIDKTAERRKAVK